MIIPPSVSGVLAMFSQWQRFWSRLLRVSPVATRRLVRGRLRQWERQLPLAIVPFETRLMPAATPTATLQTDRTDYAPGQTVSISVNGFQPGETVQFQVVRTDGQPDFPQGNQPWQVVDGGTGDLDGAVDGN